MIYAETGSEEQPQPERWIFKGKEKNGWTREFLVEIWPGEPATLASRLKGGVWSAPLDGEEA